MRQWEQPKWVCNVSKQQQNEVVNHTLEKSHRDISLRKIVAMTGGTGGDIYTIGNNLWKSAWAKTHPTDTTTDSLSLARKRHSSSWVSERDWMGFGFRLGWIFYWSSQRIARRKCSLLLSAASYKALQFFCTSSFSCFSISPLYHCPVRKIILFTVVSFFWQQEWPDKTCGYTQSLQLLQIKRQPTSLFMKYVFL